MSGNPQPSTYQELVASLKPGVARPNSAEAQLDSLITTMRDRERRAKESAVAAAPDPIQVLRDQVVTQFIPMFVELVEKYTAVGMSMQMDASNLLEGGREIAFEFGMNDYRIQLQGTVTQSSIAFHEVRHSPDVQGQLMAGPMLRLRHLDAAAFRDFVCERLTVLLRFASKRKPAH